MQIVVPMSGFGERFRKAGYSMPKPLIEVDSKPIIQHVIEMFPGEEKFIFICNENHLKEPKYKMRETLNRVCPTGRIIAIAEHKLGPVYAVLQAIEGMELDEPTIVNYCDFACYWDYSHFKKFVDNKNCDGAIPSYRNFHPHTIWNNNYAYVKEEDFCVLDIQEKKPFTANPQKEFASSGTYYFKSGKMMRKYFQQTIDDNLKVGDEYYASMPYKPMISDGLNIHVYELNYFMQWGTPQDLDEYNYWSSIFHGIIKKNQPPYHKGNLLLPMVGEGSRFRVGGYTTPKPLISVSGKPMAVQALRDLPRTDSQTFVLREDLQNLDILKAELDQASSNSSFCILKSVTDGQATTCIEGSKGLNPNLPITIAACDNGMNYDSETFSDLMEDESVDIIVWGARGYPGAIRAPEKYGWIDTDDDNGYIKKVSVKKPLSDPANDPIIVGAFMFKRLVDFIDAVTHMKSRKAKINGEYYIDTAINDAIQIGKRCKILEIEHYICWGSPNDLKTFEYWQSCFHKWSSHPYSLGEDPYLESDSLDELIKNYSTMWDNRNTCN